MVRYNAFTHKYGCISSYDILFLPTKQIILYSSIWFYNFKVSYCEMQSSFFVLLYFSMSIQSPVTLRKLYNYLHWLHQAITESLIQACHQDRASLSIFTFTVTTKTEKSSSRVDIPIKGKDILIIGGEVCFPLFSKSICIFISCLLNHGI